MVYRSRFANRHDAGRKLAMDLRNYRQRQDLLVLALPRGGVPVAYEIARALNAPLDVLIVRKLGLPGHEELAMGAIASDDVRVLNDEVIESLGLSDPIIERVARQEGEELRRREQAYRNGRPPIDVEGKMIILVDDGIATGATIRAAVKALRKQAPAEIVIAVPAATEGVVRKLEKEVDAVVCLMRPNWFIAIGEFYDDFSPVSDDEVRALLHTPDVKASPA